MASYKGTRKDGERAASLAKEREKQRKDFEERKRRLQEDHGSGLSDINSVFSETNTIMEQQFKDSTVGLQSAEEFKRKRLEIFAAKKLEEERQEKAKQKAKKRKKKERQKALLALSFNADGDDNDDDDDDDDAEIEKKMKKKKKKKKRKNIDDGTNSNNDDNHNNNNNNNNDDIEERPKKKKKKNKKCPDVATHFLPDADRKEEEERLRKKYADEWKEMQQSIKKQLLEVTYSYYDGSGHRRQITIEKGESIGHFLELARRDLAPNFHELRGMSSENLMFIKEDLIIPHHYSFYDLIVTKARGKSGPLFNFSVVDDVRLVQDVRVEKEDSHPGKLVTRGYYERNQHIFPMDRWEVYEPGKDYGAYKIKGK